MGVFWNQPVWQSVCVQNIRNFVSQTRHTGFVEAACVERDIVVTTTVRCIYMRQCVHPSEFVRTITSTIVEGFQGN